MRGHWSPFRLVGIELVGTGLAGFSRFIDVFQKDTYVPDE